MPKRILTPSSQRGRRSARSRAAVISRGYGAARSFRRVSRTAPSRLSAVNTIVGLLRDTIREWWADNALRLGAALAYYALFSLAPLLIVAIAIAGVVFEHERAHAQIVAQISGLIGRDVAEAISG